MTTTPTTPAVDQTLGTVLSARARPPRAGALAATLTFAWRALLKLRHVVLVTTYSGVTLNADRTKGVSDRFRSLPIWRPAPIVGALLGDTGRYLLASTIVVVLGLVPAIDPTAASSAWWRRWRWC